MAAARAAQKADAAAHSSALANKDILLDFLRLMRQSKVC